MEFVLFYMALETNSKFCLTKLTKRLVYIAVVGSVYSAVRSHFLYKADYVWSLDC
jgi:hypothetical protein